MGPNESSRRARPLPLGQHGRRLGRPAVASGLSTGKARGRHYRHEQPWEGGRMSPEADHDRVYADLVGGLLDARDDPATARFDHELALAVEAGQVTAATARRLRFWQRASLRLLADHTRSVLPTALGALEASRREAADHVAQLIDVVHEEAADVASGEAARAGAQSTTVESSADVTAATAPRDTPE